MRAAAACASYPPVRSCDRSSKRIATIWICSVKSPSTDGGKTAATNLPTPALCPHEGRRVSARGRTGEGNMAAQTFDPTPRLHQEEPQVIDDFVDPDDDEDCRAGLLELD